MYVSRFVLYNTFSVCMSDFRVEYHVFRVGYCVFTFNVEKRVIDLGDLFSRWITRFSHRITGFHAGLHVVSFDNTISCWIKLFRVG